MTDSIDLEPVPLVRVLLLAHIRNKPESSGYNLMKAVSEFTNGVITLSSGTVYSELRRLEKKKSISSSRENKGRRRRNYSISSQGEKELFHLIAQIEMRVEILLNPLVEFVKQDN